jgi:MFS family permease
MTTGSATSEVPSAARRRGYSLAAAVLLVMMLGGTLPAPIYVLYERQMGFGPLGVTVVFSCYVLGTLAALIVLGGLSDHVGRRTVLAIAVACAAVSTALFLVASDIWVLIVARVLSGLAAGLATGTATAALAELQPRGDHQAAAVTATGANMAGLGLGPLAAGLFAEYVPGPTHAVFWAYLVVCALAAAAVIAIPETVRHPDRAISLRPRLAVPRGMGAVVLGASLGGFAAFSVLGQFSSLVPTFVYGLLGIHNFALVGGAPFLIFVTAAVSQAVSARLPARRSASVGLPLLLVCLAGLDAALFTRTLWSFLVGTIAGGVAVGFIIRAGLSELNRVAPPEHRAAVVSTFFAVAYLGLGLPAVLTGVVSLPAGPVDASAWVSGLAVAAVVVAFFAVRRAFGAAAAPGPPCTPSDSWCRRAAELQAGPAAGAAASGAAQRGDER